MSAFNFIHLGCKKATYLMSKEEEGKVGLIGRMQIRAHLTICSLCRRFKQQTKLITSMAPHLHEQQTATLSPEKKSAIKAMLK